MSAFNVGLTGLNAAQTDLNVTGNNIANVATTGFKQSRAEFGDLFAQSFASSSKTAVGQGANVLSVTQLFSPGPIELTNNGLDLAISGNGFFVLDDPNGSRVYSRAGEYQVDRDGYITNTSGQRLQGFDPLDETDSNTTFSVGSPQDIQLTTSKIEPKATTTIDSIVNLDANAEVPPGVVAGGTFAFPDPTPDTYNFSTQVTTYDSLGTPRPVTLFFQRTDAGGGVADPLNWDLYVGMTDDDPASATFGQVVDVGSAAPQNITFDALGQLTTADPVITISSINDPFLDNGANGFVDLPVNLAGSTQYDGDNEVSITADGYTSGQLSGINVDETGRVFAQFTNNQSKVLSQVALANFINPQGLAQLGDNNWQETYASGGVSIGAPATAGLGSIQSSALEGSNVDLAEQLVNLITGQRNYQANAKTLETANAITQTILNIR
ncbi:flagellar hook protein FlgE [Rhabdochromatium marinum]|uniref:flagellar hook protein FlgE n=1 Tax=Rhabdochromatium marinum TaxID=48729 RepID=UPI00190348ED|nr:flagellar hook protein FlgE [Rhabdochromatium marinum]MBK1647466.1 hypothetical protein [Rhabdochromatium marinum]